MWGWIGHNPAKLATAPSVQKADVRPPQAEHATRLLSAAMAVGQLAAAAGLSASYARALVAEFQAQPPAALQQNGRRPAAASITEADLEAAR